jgi:aspartokinase/homoserine dehydrogenase 1
VGAAVAVRRVHAAFQLSKIGGGRPASIPYTDVVFLGFGRVGRALADQIAAATEGPPVRVVGVLDRSGYVFEPKGITSRRLMELARDKDKGALIASLGGTKASATDGLAFIASHAVSHPVVVDVTSEDHGALLRLSARCDGPLRPRRDNLLVDDREPDPATLVDGTRQPPAPDPRDRRS